MLVNSQLMPAYHAAVNALDAPAALELAKGITDMARGARGDLDDAAARLGFDGGDARAWEKGDAPSPDTTDWEANVRQRTDYDLARKELQELTARLPHDLGPRVYRGTVISDDPAPAGLQTIEAAAGEAAATIQLLNTVKQMRELMFSGQTGSLQAAVDLAEGWRGRPVNFLFLYTVLDQEMLLGPLSVLGGSKTHRNIFGMHAQAEASAKDFGMLMDVGAFELDEAVTLLSYYWDDWAITDEDANKVLEMWASASPEARVTILEKLEAEGRLGRLCSNSPGLAVKAMADVARLRPGSAADKTLRAAVEDQPQGETVTELYEQNIMEDIKDEKYVRAYLWTFLNVAHSALTFGFKNIHDNAYIQMRQGLITEDQYWSTTTKAAGRSGLILAATALSGGAAGGWAEGAALESGIGATTSTLIGGGVGGGAAGLTGQLTADLYDQALLGKKGFSSASDYLKATGGGIVAGTLLAGVGAAAGQAYPESALETFRYHSGGGRYRVLEDFRQGMHELTYRMYRGSVSAGRRAASGGAPDNADFFDPDRLAHILEGEGTAQGGHRWPSNPKGGTQGPYGPDPKSSFPRTWNDEHIVDTVADIVTDPHTVWTQQTGPGQGQLVTGLPARPPTTAAGAPVRYRTDVNVGGVNVRVVVEPGGEGIITAFPVGYQDPANLLQFIKPQVTGTGKKSDDDE